MHLSNSNFYRIHLSAVASKAALPCCTAPTREATTTMHPAIGKTRKTHGNTGLLPLLMHPSVPLSRFCVLGVFCVSTHPQPRCCRALCGRAFSGMAFPLSSAQGQRQNALKPPAGGAAVFASLAVNSPNRFPFAPFSFIWGTSVDAPGGAGGGEALV